MLSEQLDTTNKKVLVIDDDAAVRLMARAALEQYGFNVAEATDGLQGIEVFKITQPDIVLLDVMMSEMHGFEACAALRSLPGGESIPIIMMTGCDDIESISQAFRSGATEFLTKPINWLTLPYHIRYMIRSCQAFENLQKSEQQNSVILRTLPDMVLYVNKNGTIIRRNKFSSSNDALHCFNPSSKKIADSFPADFARSIMEAIENSLDNKKEIVFECSVEHTGIVNYYETRIVKSGLEEYLVIIRSITDKITAQQELKKNKEYLEAIINNSIDGILTTDWLGNVTSVNPAVERIFKCTEADLRGKHFAEFVNDDDPLKPKIQSKMHELMEQGWASYELTYSRDDGEKIEVECNTSLIKDENGNPVSAVSILRDITERRKIDAHLLQTEKLRSLGELSAGVAHDFNNILAVIIGRSQMLKKNLDFPLKDEKRKTMIELKKGLDIIEKAALDGSETVNRIQQFSRKEANSRNFIMLDINQILNDVVEFIKPLLKNAAQQKGINVSIKKKFSSIAPIEGVASHLREVFTNLTKNALDAMPNGGVLSLGTFMDGNNVVIKIKDSGRGMPPEIRERIFDPFFTTKGVQSTGLGLSISYGIINQHYGNITVDSIEGEGTTFTIYLPQAAASKKEAEVKLNELLSPAVPAKILIIDDEEEIRGLLQEIVSADGHVVDIAPDGASGLKKLGIQQYDLVLTDVGMPGLSGWDVAKKVKEINQKTPVALITGYNIIFEVADLKEKGVDFVLQKPFHVAEVQQLIARGIHLKDSLFYH